MAKSTRLLKLLMKLQLLHSTHLIASQLNLGGFVDAICDSDNALHEKTSLHLKGMVLALGCSLGERLRCRFALIRYLNVF